MEAAAAVPSERYKRLLEVIEKTLVQSRNNIDLKKVIDEAYGEDAAIFGDNNVLTNMLATMLKKVHTDVSVEMERFLVENDVEEKLQKVEGIIRALQQQDERAERARNQQRNSVERALKNTLLPEGSSAMDVIKYRAYQKMQQEKEALEKELAGVEEQVTEMQQREQELVSSLDGDLQQLQQLGKEFEKSADVCSMVTT